MAAASLVAICALVVILAGYVSSTLSLVSRTSALESVIGSDVHFLAIASSGFALGLTLIGASLLLRAWTRLRVAEVQQRILAQQLTSGLASFAQGVAVFAADSTLRHWNPKFSDLLDLPPPLLRAGLGYAAIVGLLQDRRRPGQELVLEPCFPTTAEPGGSGVPVLRECIGPGDRNLEIRSAPIETGGLVLTIGDMTERVQNERALLQSQKMQAIGQLTGGIAHDFNNLLTVIVGNIEAVQLELGSMSPGATDAGLRQHLGQAAGAADRGAGLSRQLLAFARRQPLLPELVDLALLLPDLMPLLRRTLGERIEILLDLPEGEWLVTIDPIQLESAILNLALNARDAMPGGGVLAIRLAAGAADPVGTAARAPRGRPDVFELSLADTGQGMSEAVASRAFEAFFTTKADRGGTGLGLATLSAFASRSGGAARLVSQPGLGTTVTIQLPRTAGHAPDASARTLSPSGIPRGEGRILLVEDSADVRKIVADTLRTLGYRVCEAEDGCVALRMLSDRSDRIDLLLTDIGLPGPLDGFALAERSAQLRPGIRVLYMSGYGDETGTVSHRRRAPAGMLIGKPFRREQLARAVYETLRSSGKAAAA
ncbi:response regulator [Lichenicola cladoniae]|uniref:histidine kinase n=1 Tax=Lichenicola cladoniae TaxID=1484109 RepID=A0A6M8HS46_9PROT|nr:ATP-binding protein [Lichenicola cladoniae]NPD65842.1 response regulator [Acetobacteraceae bacterium]QKE91152.1 response regulator [Lichenicola cladoniae]